MRKKVIPIDSNLPANTQLEMHKVNARTIRDVAQEKTKQIALAGLAFVAFVIAAGSIYLSSQKLETPQFMAPVFASVATAMGMPLSFAAGAAYGSSKERDREKDVPKE